MTLVPARALQPVKRGPADGESLLDGAQGAFVERGRREGPTTDFRDDKARRDSVPCRRRSRTHGRHRRASLDHAHRQPGIADAGDGNWYGHGRRPFDARWLPAGAVGVGRGVVPSLGWVVAVPARRALAGRLVLLVLVVGARAGDHHVGLTQFAEHVVERAVKCRLARRGQGQRFVSLTDGVPVDATQARVVVLIPHGSPGGVQDHAALGRSLLAARLGRGDGSRRERRWLQARIGRRRG